VIELGGRNRADAFATPWHSLQHRRHVYDNALPLLGADGLVASQLGQNGIYGRLDPVVELALCLGIEVKGDWATFAIGNRRGGLSRKCVQIIPGRPGSSKASSWACGV
jgi:hypothetical protein